MSSRYPPQNPVCQFCAKPIESGSYAVLPHGKRLHVRCRSPILEAEAMEAVAREAPQPRTARLMEQNLELRRARRLDRCPVCGEPASILDWRPSVPWLAVDGCRCDGSFVWTALVETRLPGLSAEDRALLSARIRSLRKTGKEAWLLTDDDTPGGALVLSDQRPEHVT